MSNRLEWYQWYYMEPYIESVVSEVKGRNDLIKCTSFKNFNHESIVYKGVPVICVLEFDLLSGEAILRAQVRTSENISYCCESLPFDMDETKEPSKQLINAVKESRGE